MPLRTVTAAHRKNLARLHGGAAYLAGFDLQENPYRQGHLRAAWQDGWVGEKLKAEGKPEG
jgi:hypothetical protein